MGWGLAFRSASMFSFDEGEALKEQSVEKCWKRKGIEKGKECS